ncbi:MAG: serine hydrolase domain-containing protein, partial [Gemmatimonas sp.]
MTRRTSRHAVTVMRAPSAGSVRRAARAAAASLLVSMPSFANAQRNPRSLDALLAPVREAARVPALGAAVVTPQGLMAIGTAGKRAEGATARVTNNDRWHLGSCTKALTAVLVARLVDRGVLRWESTVA